MENNQNEPQAYRPRTGRLESKNVAPAEQTPHVEEVVERPAPTFQAPPAHEVGDERPARRTPTRESFFKNRTPQGEAEGDRPRYNDDRPRRDSRPTSGYGSDRPRYGDRFGGDKPRSYSSYRDNRDGRRDDYDRPRRPAGSDGFDRPKSDAGFDKFRSERPQRRDFSSFQKPDGDRPPFRKPFGSRDDRPAWRDDKPRRDQPFGERRSFDSRGGGGFRHDDRPSAPRKPYGERDSYEARPPRYGDRRDDSPRPARYGDRHDDGSRPPRYSDRRDDGPRPPRYSDRRDDGSRPPRYSDRRDDSPRPARYGDRYDDRSRPPRYDDRRDDRRDNRYDDSARPPRKPPVEIQVKDPNSPIRLNKFIANSGVCSRREADEYIQRGDITVNGTVVKELGVKVQPTDEICWHGEKLSGEKKVYLVLNKPKGYVTTVEDPHADRTVMDLIAGACSERVYPVGRLDKNTSGVLLFTNDGDLTKQLTHPSYNKRKVYQITLDKTLKKEDMDKLVEGVELEDGMAVADEVGYTNLDDKAEVGLEIHSGRNRVVRRMFEALGYEVQKLDRVYFAGLTKKSLERGKWRKLNPKEISILKMGAYE
ncbi:MAG: pseudouridine synthase [Prevotellaceae bacterium]|jgi:23S rRNA pseudouridine2605 synthase|nr:pseudouridine synthase [Prevotellaceae bacterium]